MIIRPELSIIKDCDIAESATIHPFVNLYGASIGAGSSVCPFVEIGRAVVGQRTVISSHSYLCPGVAIGDDCFIAHSVMFTNDIFSDVPTYFTREELRRRWTLRITGVGHRVRIGSGAVILPVFIGDGAIIGAGAVVTKDVGPGEIVAGVPARLLRRV